MCVTCNSVSFSSHPSSRDPKHSIRSRGAFQTPYASSVSFLWHSFQWGGGRTLQADSFFYPLSPWQKFLPILWLYVTQASMAFSGIPHQFSQRAYKVLHIKNASPKQTRTVIWLASAKPRPKPCHDSSSFLSFILWSFLPLSKFSRNHSLCLLSFATSQTQTFGGAQGDQCPRGWKTLRSLTPVF